MIEARFNIEVDKEQSEMTISFGNKEKRKLFITIRDLYGRVLQNKLMTVPLNLDTSSFRPGSYFIETIDSRKIIRTPFKIGV